MSTICSFSKHPLPTVTIDCHADDKPNKWNGTECCADCYAKAQLDYRSGWAQHDAETNACGACQAARAQQAERTQRTETIDPSRCYGEHIPLLCRDHLDGKLSWHTKNINAGRSIFFNGFGKGLVECDCPAHRLFSPGRFIYKLCYLLGTDNLYRGD